MHICTGADLGPQLWVGPCLPAELLFQPTYMEPRNGRPQSKPNGGFWTSSLVLPCGSAWVDYLRGNEQHDDLNGYYWSLMPDPAARIVVIDCFADFRAVLDRWPYWWPDVPELRRREPHYPTIARHGFAGVHLTERGRRETAYQPREHLYGWDCESTLWLRWAFPTEPVLLAPATGAVDTNLVDEMRSEMRRLRAWSVSRAG